MVDVVYIDEIFILNLIMNTVVLLMVKKLRGLAATFPQLVGAAAIGASGLVVLCLVRLWPAVEFTIALLILPLFMLFTAFRIRNAKSNILNLFTLYLNSAMMGGMIQIIFYHTTLYNHLHVSDTQQVPEISVIRFVVGLCLTAVLVFIIIKLYGYKCHVTDVRCTVCLTIHGKKAEINALVDTGNSLYEPISHQPVCVLCYPTLKKYFQKSDENQCRIIPARTAGGGQGWFYAVPIEEMEVRMNHWRGSFENVYVALDEKEFGGCQMLLHPEFIRGAGGSACTGGQTYDFTCSGSHKI